MFLIIGIWIAVSDRKNSDTYLYFPILCVAIPMMIFIPLSIYLSTFSEYSDIAYVMLYAPPVLILAWLALTMFGI